MTVVHSKEADVFCLMAAVVFWELGIYFLFTSISTKSDQSLEFYLQFMSN